VRENVFDYDALSLSLFTNAPPSPIRLLVPYLGQALTLVDRGVATTEDVDVAMRLGAGHPMVR
jgi:hypothetical protein